ncbi:glutathione S-transferase family protein [Maricaulis parjimensis]|uniref:glutathione S-transferase family protein n=1 Tax=Maricaulis parjimensis TaxID=144023 RepID=UPI00193AB7B5|nr:glutathione S-transferase family protein [Maricaulis parjimensis]
MTANLKLYHAPRTRSVRVRWLLEEMGLAHEVVPVAFDKRPAGDEAYAKINPMRKVPAFEADGEILVESLAIMEFIMNRYGPTDLQPAVDDPDYGRYLQWFHFGEAGLCVGVNMVLGHTFLLPEKARNPAIAAWAWSETLKGLEFIGNHGLADSEYLAGDRFTAADISVGYMLYLLKLIGKLGDAPENVQAYFKRITARESWAVASAVD